MFTGKPTYWPTDRTFLLCEKYSRKLNTGERSLGYELRSLTYHNVTKTFLRLVNKLTDWERFQIDQDKAVELSVL